MGSSRSKPENLKPERLHLPCMPQNYFTKYFTMSPCRAGRPLPPDARGTTNPKLNTSTFNMAPGVTTNLTSTLTSDPVKVQEGQLDMDSKSVLSVSQHSETGSVSHTAASVDPSTRSPGGHLSADPGSRSSEGHLSLSAGPSQLRSPQSTGRKH